MVCRGRPRGPRRLARCVADARRARCARGRRGPRQAGTPRPAPARGGGMDLTFRLLGPVAVDAPDGPVDVGPARQRTVLAALLVDAGHLVPIDTVVNRVWGPAPPDRSRQTLHVYIARLRQALGPSVRLVGRSGAYLLDLEP